MRKVDYIIVGHGISGAVISTMLRTQRKSVLVFDQASRNQSSSVAVGLFHPMAFRQTLYSWMGIEVFNSSLEFYQQHYAQFILKMPLYRVLSDVEEYNRWYERLGDPTFKNVLDVVKGYPGVNSPHGLGKVSACAKIDVQEMIKSNRESLKLEDAYLEDSFPYDLVDAATNTLTYKGHSFSFSKIIFCEGLGVESNPWFSFLRFHPAKGDLLKIKLNTEYGFAVNKKHFIAPDGNGDHWLGATYNWKNIVPIPDEDAKNELLSVANEFLESKPVVKEHLVGVRPASYDRRPFVGQHPEHKDLAVLNGMGSKALILAPYCSRLLLDSIVEGAEIPRELSIDRLEKFRKA